MTRARARRDEPGALLGNRWLRSLAVVLVGWVAQSGCLHAVTWYLDDSWQVHDSEYVEGGFWWQDPSLLLTRLSYYLTWRLAGFSTVAFHLGNLALHLTVALSIYWLGRHLLALPDRSDPAAWETPAWLAAMIFAVHPLTTEITHYIRARDHGLVTLFSFLAAGFTALAVRRSPRWWAAAAGAVVLAAFSKGPGLPQAVSFVGLVLLAAVPAGTPWRALWPQRRHLLIAALTVLVLAGLLSSQIGHLGAAFFREIRGERFALHALTQARVLPQYLWRMILPIHLCSDHLVAWTKNFRDLTAWIWLGVTVALVTGIFVLWRRGAQPWAFLGALALSALLLRWLYVVSEFMVEYRAYPAMPWVTMLFALVLWRCHRRWPRAAASACVVIICVFALLCRRRSSDWASSEALHAQILSLYPLQLRAFIGLSTDDMREGRYQAILDRQPDFYRRLQTVFARNRTDPHRHLENWPLWAVNEECMLGEAIAHLQNSYSGMDALDLTAWRMNENHIDDEMLWAQWHFSVANVFSLRGDNERALREYRVARQSMPGSMLVRRRIEAILAAPGGVHGGTEIDRSAETGPK